MESLEHATNIVKKLRSAGHIAYFAGGWVRDFVMEHPSSDIDIATDASPEKILDLFPRTLLIGLSFGVVIVIIEGHQFEVSTFRRDIGYVNGRKPTGIELSGPEEDAMRRDFTINGMFYDPIEERIIDYVGGKEDIRKGIIRAIGDPDERFNEDRLRMIRAARFAARFRFNIDPETQEGIRANADTLFPAVAMERIWQEINKMSKYSYFDHALIDMHRLGLLPVIFPILAGTHLNEIKKRVASLPHFPKEAPAILALMELFPEMLLPEQLELCQYLRTSQHDAALVKYVFSFRKGTEDAVEWAHLYAHPLSGVVEQAVAARLPHIEREAYLAGHALRKSLLKPHIDRIKSNKPWVTAAMLQKEGISPGIQMGLLIREAERIAITHDLQDPYEILSTLKKMHWKKT